MARAPYRWFGPVGLVLLTGLLGMAVVIPMPAFAQQQTVPESMTEFAFSTPNVTAQTGQTVHFALSNDGQFPHSLALDEASGLTVLDQPDAFIQPGDSGAVDVTFTQPGTYTFYCPVPTHRERGMVGTITITAPAPATPAATPTPAPPPAPAPRARDGQSLDSQSAATRAMFIAVWGSRAGDEWVTEHNAALGR